MSSGLYPCTAANPMGADPDDGLLGEGSLPWPSVVASRRYPSTIGIGGRYATDDFSAAEFLIGELTDAESDLTKAESNIYLALLVELMEKLRTADDVSAEQFLALKAKAESIPVVGSALFSSSNLPGTLANIAAIGYSASKVKSVEDILDLSEPLKKKLREWAATRGTNSSQSPHRAFKDHIKLVRVGNALMFEIPANAQANIYRFAGKHVGDVVHVPAFNTAQALRNSAHVDSAAYGLKGIGKVLTGPSVGGLLAFGPQLYIDVSTSSTPDEILRKSAYSQPTNALAFASGIIVGAMVSGPAVIVVAVIMVTGLIIQVAMSESVTGWGKEVGDWLMGAD